MMRKSIRAASAVFLLCAIVLQTACDETVPLGRPLEPPMAILLAVGDVSLCGHDDDELHDEKVAALVKKAVAQARKRGVPVRVILMGDLAYEAGTKADFKKCFDPAWRELKPIMLPVPGNHEYTAKQYGVEYKKQPEKGPIAHGFAPEVVVNLDELEHAKPYFEYFQLQPKNNDGKPLISSEGPGTGYYAIRFPKKTKGSWLLVGLNTYSKSKVKPKMKDWLKYRLKANEQEGETKARCILAFSHHFRYSTGLHGHYYEAEDSGAELGDRSHLKKVFRILQKNRASVLLSGHDHHFEQFPRMDNYWDKDKRGVRSFIVGTGGAELYLDVIKNTYGTVYEEMSDLTEHLIPNKHGIMKIELFAERYSWAFLPVDGEPIVPKIHQDTCRTR